MNTQPYNPSTLKPLTPAHAQRIQGGYTLTTNPHITNIAAFPDVCMTPPQTTNFNANKAHKTHIPSI